jgi:uncharacterized protein (DUF2062 family)
MGIFPVWGFQLGIAITASFLLRLNKVLVIIAANISVPPMIPLILYLSHRCGAMWMGDGAQIISFDKEITLPLVMDNLVQYIAGAVTLSVSSGVLVGGVTYLALRAYKHSLTGR